MVSEYDQEIPQSQTANKPMAPRGRATQQSRASGRQPKQRLKIGQQAMALNFPTQKHSVYISVICAGNTMILFYIYMDRLFLGILFDRKLSFIPHIKYLKAKCIKALNHLKVLSHTSRDADQTYLIKLYRSLVRSKLYYGCTIYGSARKSYLQMLDHIYNQGLG